MKLRFWSACTILEQPQLSEGQVPQSGVSRNMNKIYQTLNMFAKYNVVLSVRISVLKT